MRGIEFIEMEQIMKAELSLQDRRLIEALVAKRSLLVGMTVAGANFRSEYWGAVIAIQGGSVRIHEHPFNVKLETGDALLIQGGPYRCFSNTTTTTTKHLPLYVRLKTPAHHALGC